MINATARSRDWSKSGAMRLLIVVLLFELLAWALIRSSEGLGSDLWLLGAGATALLTTAAFCIASLVRNRFRFGLRALLFGMLVVGGGLGWIGMFLEPTKQQRRILRNLEQFDLRVGYEHRVVPGIETLLGSEYFQRVTGLNLDCARTTSFDHAQIAELQSLKSLSLWGDAVTDEDVGRFRTLRNLELLNVHSSRATGAALAELRQLKHLQHLGIGRAREVDLASLRLFPALKSLVLSDSAVTDDDLRHLAALHNLEMLNLGGTKVTNAGLVHLKGLTKLKYLNVTATAVSDAGLAHLKGLTQLHQIWPSNQITADGLRSLREMAPGLHVPDE